MAGATADWQQKIGELRLTTPRMPDGHEKQDYGALADLSCGAWWRKHWRLKP